MYRHLSHFGLILGISCLLGACGFHLRGMGDGGTALPDTWKSMNLVTDNPNGEFSRAVAAQLAANGVQWTDSGSANFSLLLSPENFSQRNLSLNSEARVAEIELSMNAQFSVVDASKAEVIPPTTVSVLKQMENDPRNVVGKDGEMRMIQAEMRTELAEQIMRRIGFFATSSQSQPATPTTP
jgi:LPS-assembly lipoprotein